MNGLHPSGAKRLLILAHRDVHDAPLDARDDRALRLPLDGANAVAHPRDLLQQLLVGSSLHGNDAPRGAGWRWRVGTHAAGFAARRPLPSTVNRLTTAQGQRDAPLRPSGDRARPASGPMQPAAALLLAREGLVPPTRHVPAEHPPEQGALTDARRRAAALPATRVVDPLTQRPAHAATVRPGLRCVTCPPPRS